MNICKDIYNKVGPCCNCCKHYDPMDGYCSKNDENMHSDEKCPSFKLGED